MRVWRSAWLSMAALALLSGAARAQQTEVNEQGEEIRVVTDDGLAIEYQRDDSGRVIAERHPDGTVVSYWYDPDGVRHTVTGAHEE